MKIYRIPSLFLSFFLIFFTGCEDDDFTAVELPSEVGEIQLNFSVSNNDSGDVTVSATGEGFIAFSFLFGDAEDEEPTLVSAGRDFTHTYSEGTFTLTVTGVSPAGITEVMVTQELVVAFTQPTNLVTNIRTNNRNISVIPSADNVTSFEVFFGDTENEEPTMIIPGDTATHTYEVDGEFVIKTIARGVSVTPVERLDTVQVVLLEEPVTAAPVPTQDPANVISMFSEIYTDITVDTWRTVWSDSDFEDVVLAGSTVKKYSNLNFVGVETTQSPIDAASMTHLRLDFWTTNSTEFRIKLVDFGADGAFDGGDDVEHEISLTDLELNTWVSLDIPLADFTGLVTRSSIQQLIFSSDPTGSSTVFIDNVYFYASEEPRDQAPVPTQDASAVISLFSEVYTDVAVDTWRTSWSDANFEDVTLAGSAVKKYTDLNFVGIETTTPPIDASAMTHFSFDFWTPNSTQLRVKLVDFGADGAFGGGDDVEHEITIDNPVQGQWVSEDIPLADFTGLTTRSSIQQLIFSSDPSGSSTVFVDNIYFYSN